MRADEAAQPDKVKVVCSRSGRALYFSRAPIPFARDALGGLAQNSADKMDFLAHIGLYAFRFEALRVFTGLPPSSLELTEKLEQLRLLENDIPIQVVRTQGISLGVDRPDDLAEAIRVLERVNIENI
jgi:3-deoxy-manno-octulosonate cytidylyltransferase (CMP-KDO synthetase)